MSDPTFTNPPETPSRGNATFSGQVASFLAWLTVFVPQLVTAVSWMRGKVDEVSGNASQVATDATLAETARQGAEQARDSAAGSVAGAGAPAWVSGTTYAIGNVRYSPITFKTYRRRTAGAGTVDPSVDKANWSDLTVPVSGDGALDKLTVKYATLNGTALTSGHFAEFQEQGKRALRNILGTAAAAYDFTDYLALDGAQSAFTDTAGTTALTAPGTSLARMNDATGNAANAVQANAGQRPLYGRSPREVRNIIPNNVTEASATLTNITVSPISGDPQFPDVLELTNTSANDYHALYFSSPQDGLQYARSVRVKKPNADGIRYVSIGEATAPTSAVNATIFDLDTGQYTQIGSAQTPVFDIIPLADGWFQIGFARQSNTSGSSRFHIALSKLPTGSGEGLKYAGAGEKLLIALPQIELGVTATKPQRTAANGFDITEKGVPSYGFVRLDNSDDALPTVFPDGHTGDLLIFGRKGTWIEPNTVASAGTFTLGGTIAGTPATPGIIRATGDVLGYLLAGKTLTNEETRRLTQYYASMGAKGMLELGPELITNGDFSDGETGWNFEPSWSVVGSKAVGLGSGFITQPIPLIAGEPYLVSFDRTVSAGALASNFRLPATTIANSTTSGFTRIVAFPAVGNTVIGISGNATFDGSVDNISVRKLTPQDAF